MGPEAQGPQPKVQPVCIRMRKGDSIACIVEVSDAIHMDAKTGH
jgi:hypothetical protein